MYIQKTSKNGKRPLFLSLAIFASHIKKLLTIFCSKYWISKKEEIYSIFTVCEQFGVNFYTYIKQ